MLRGHHVFHCPQERNTTFNHKASKVCGYPVATVLTITKPGWAPVDRLAQRLTGHRPSGETHLFVFASAMHCFVQPLVFTKLLPSCTRHARRPTPWEYGALESLAASNSKSGVLVSSSTLTGPGKQPRGYFQGLVNRFLRGARVSGVLKTPKTSKTLKTHIGHVFSVFSRPRPVWICHGSPGFWGFPVKTCLKTLKTLKTLQTHL